MIGIIPAAGQGVRFKELGKHYNKTTLPYKEKPILIHQIEWLESCGCDDIIVVVNHQASTIRDILQMYGKKVTITIQANRNGLSGAVYAALDTVSKDTSVMVLLGDLVVNSQISPESYDTNFISVQQVTDYNRWCMVSKVGTTIQFYDKPTERPPTDLAVSGVYFIRSSDMLHELLHVQLTDESKKIAGEFQISSVLQQIADTEVMNTIVLDIVDFGTLEEYLDNRTIKISR